MRITNNMLVRDMLWNANKNLVSMSDRQRELSTGKRIHRASDDPVGTTLLLKYKTDIAEAEQYKKNIQDGLGWMEVTESSLMNVKEILQRIRELTVRGANGTNTTSDTQKIKSEIDELTKELQVLGNTTNAGRYVFSGLETDTKLFKDDGTYNVLMTSERVLKKPVPAYEIAIGEVMDMGTHPMDVFGITENLSFFKDIFQYGTLNSTKATQTSMTHDVDVTQFPNPPVDLTFTVGADTFTVPAAELINVPGNRMTKERLLTAINGADNGGGVKFSEKASVFFNADDKLVIQAKDYGNMAVSTGGSAALTNNVTALGTNASIETKTGTGLLSDVAVAAATGTETFAFEYDNTRYVIDIDMSTLNTVGDFQTALQNAFDSKLPAGLVTVNAADGATLDFVFTAPSDGEVHQLKMDYVVSDKSELIEDLKALSSALNTGDNAVIQQSLTELDTHLNTVLNALGEIGGKTNRIEYIQARVDENKLTFTGLLSKVQDVDMAEAIMWFKNLENIYRASLSVGSKVIQPSLVDFIR